MIIYIFDKFLKHIFFIFSFLIIALTYEWCRIINENTKIIICYSTHGYNNVYKSIYEDKSRPIYLLISE